MIRAAIVASIAALLVLPSPASASRAPTMRERHAIVAIYPASYRNAPARCVWFDIRVSTRNSRYAYVGINFDYLDRGCIRYAHNGFDIVKRTGTRWKIVYSGSDSPACRLGFPRDIVKCSP